VRSLKLCQTNRVRQAHGIWLRWQSSFYDHVLRDSDRRAEVAAIAEYIAANPVRAGLTDTPEAYPFTHRRAGATPPAASHARSNPT